MMLPSKVMRRLKSNLQKSRSDEMICAGYTPTTFKPKHKADVGKKLQAGFTVWRFHLLPSSIAQQCAHLERNSIGKELRLKSSHISGPAFLVALPVASADGSDGPDSDEDPR